LCRTYFLFSVMVMLSGTLKSKSRSEKFLSQKNRM
jgi:hypothetical protein